MEENDKFEKSIIKNKEIAQKTINVCPSNFFPLYYMGENFQNEDVQP